MADVILTKYLGPTNTKGSRIKVSLGRSSEVSLTVSWNYDLDVKENHHSAAVAFCEKYNRNSNLVGGEMKRGFAWIAV